MIRTSLYNLKLLLYLIFTIIFFLITSCNPKPPNPEQVATTKKYEKILDSWMGETDSNLISSWGAPSSTYEMSNGNIFVGEFKDGKRWNGTGYDNNGNNTGKYVNGVKQR